MRMFVSHKRFLLQNLTCNREFGGLNFKNFPFDSHLLLAYKRVFLVSVPRNEKMPVVCLLSSGKITCTWKCVSLEELLAPQESLI